MIVRLIHPNLTHTHREARSVDVIRGVLYLDGRRFAELDGPYGEWRRYEEGKKPFGSFCVYPSVADLPEYRR